MSGAAPLTFTPSPPHFRFVTFAPVIVFDKLIGAARVFSRLPTQSGSQMFYFSSTCFGLVFRQNFHTYGVSTVLNDNSTVTLVFSLFGQRPRRGRSPVVSPHMEKGSIFFLFPSFSFSPPLEPSQLAQRPFQLALRPSQLALRPPSWLQGSPCLIRGPPSAAASSEDLIACLETLPTGSKALLA